MLAHVDMKRIAFEKMAFDSPIYTDRAQIIAQFNDIRRDSMNLAAPLSPEDWMLQSMGEASPVKWNLAHTSWFFETFLLKIHGTDYTEFDTTFSYLFNSYYNQVGKMHPRNRRGLISRPSADEVIEYRAHIDRAVIRYLENASDDHVDQVASLIALGLSHEQQHQELLLTDIKHAFYQNMTRPIAYNGGESQKQNAPALEWREMEGGLCDFGANGDGFHFDNEGPRHKAFLQPFLMANRPVTNGDYIEFIDDGGYEDPTLWLSDGWACVCAEEWSAPLYWHKKDDGWVEYTLFGERPINPHAPLCHISHFEANAFANWAGARLPTEFEWEAAASLQPMQGRFLRSGEPRAPDIAEAGEGLRQMFGDVWEWTASPYVAYPGFATPAGAVGEYNGKFMSGQMVLRGGSCATPENHIRVSYRNFFPPNARWQFSGMRLAKDIKS